MTGMYADHKGEIIGVDSFNRNGRKLRDLSNIKEVLLSALEQVHSLDRLIVCISKDNEKGSQGLHNQLNGNDIH